MKRLLLLLLVAIPLFGAGVHFIYYDYGYDDGGYWYDEYWEDEYWYDGYWVYYPHGYYCIHFIWWYPWWWDWYWWRCHWCHHFCWDFFYSGFYTVWYEDGYWWFRPRYGRWVRYRVPYAYHVIRYRAQSHGIYLPDKPPREIVIPYKEREIRKLVKQRDPELFTRVEKEHQSGNLERMKTAYTAQVQKEIEKKNREHGIKNTPKDYTKITGNRQPGYTPTKHIDTRETKMPYTRAEKSTSHIQKREKEQRTVKKAPYSPYKDDEEKKMEKRPMTKKSTQDRYNKERKDADRGKSKKSTHNEKEKRTVDKRGKIGKPSSKKMR